MKTLIVASISLTAFLLGSPHATGQSFDSAYAFYPLHVGDTWEYDWKRYITNPPFHMYYQTTDVISDITMPNGLHYFDLQSTYTNPTRIYHALQRVDSADGYVHVWSGGDRMTGINLRSTYRSVDTVFAIPVEVRHTGYTDETCDLAYGFGIVVQREYGGGWPDRSNIIYARVNGVEFGTPLATALDPSHPGRFELCQNYPNPFNPSTTIRYGLPNRSHVTLTVFNILGQQVTILQNAEQDAGYHEVRFDGSGLSSGLYFYRLQAGEHVQTRKLLLIR
jgi:hypothetical protein